MSIGKTFITLIAAIPIIAFAQVYEEWVARYIDPNDDRAEAIAVDTSGNIYVTGYSGGGSPTWCDYDYVTIKYNPQGTQQWLARYNGPGDSTDQAYALAVDASGNVYVTGASLEDSNKGSAYSTIKYNSQGVQQWVARYKGPGNWDDAKATAIAVDASGNVYVTGSSWDTTIATTYGDYCTIKYSPQGVQQWVARYDGPGNGYDKAHAIAVDGAGNVYVTGRSKDSTSGVDYATIKYNSKGVLQWVNRYSWSGFLSDEATAIAVDAKHNYGP